MNVGFIGLGDMGQAIVPRLLDAGHRVTGWNRSEEKAEPLLTRGMLWANSPRQLAAESDIVFSIVTDSAAVRAVALGENGIISGMRKDGVYLDMSTIDPEASRAVGAEFAKAGLTMMDAPISGTTLTIGQGKASVMVGGDRAAFDRVQPVLLVIGPKVSYIGAQGLAVQLKVALNMTLVIEVIGFCEGVALAEKGGVPREVAVDAMLKSVVASPVISYRAPLILEGHISDATYGDVNLQQKDMLLALTLGRRMGVPVPLGAAANEMLNACRGLGLEHHDFVTVYEVYRRLGGMSK
ncbi:MAG TPA: NAD(P)-dependent oxidoreductase [Candidatus Acidoferrum sp.]|jgi:3-hydroxyisobutyrate dehydrogenase-like beta-hydroxyacid dehydrogenase